MRSFVRKKHNFIFLFLFEFEDRYVKVSLCWTFLKKFISFWVYEFFLSLMIRILIKSDELFSFNIVLLWWMLWNRAWVEKFCSSCACKQTKLSIGLKTWDSTSWEKIFQQPKRKEKIRIKVLYFKQTINTL